MGDFLYIDVTGLKEINDKLNRLPNEAVDAGTDNANEYLLNVMQTYPPKKSVTRKAAYGVTFFSDKQRRWFFANLNKGTIDVPYNRTQGLAQSWKIVGSGRNSFLANEAPAAPYVIGDNTQSRHEAMVGWKTVGEQVKGRMTEIVRRFDAGVKKAIRQLGL